MQNLADIHPTGAVDKIDRFDDGKLRSLVEQNGIVKGITFILFEKNKYYKKYICKLILK